MLADWALVLPVVLVCASDHSVVVLAVELFCTSTVWEGSHLHRSGRNTMPTTDTSNYTNSLFLINTSQ